MQCLTDLRELGYQVGSGFMIGLPGSTPEMIANDILFATRLKLDMIGCGPFLSHPDTPLAEKPLLEDRGVYYKTIALRLLNPTAHIPATTAFDALDADGRNPRAQARRANVHAQCHARQIPPHVPGFTPTSRAWTRTAPPARSARSRLASLGREIGSGPGHSQREP